MPAPLLSVIVPVFNGAFLEEAIASIRQSARGPLEIVVVDDGSTDGIAARVAESAGPSIIYMRQATTGPAGARNTGLTKATGELIGFLDADDLWTKTHVATALAYLESHP